MRLLHLRLRLCLHPRLRLSLSKVEEEAGSGLLRKHVPYPGGQAATWSTMRGRRGCQSRNALGTRDEGRGTRDQGS